MWLREDMPSPGSGNPCLWECLWHWRFKHKDMGRKISQSFKGKSGRLKFAHVFVGSSEGAELNSLQITQKGLEKLPRGSPQKSSYMLIYAVIFFDPRESCFMFGHLCLPTHLWDPLNDSGEGKRVEKKGSHENVKLPIHKLRCIFLCLCLNILYTVCHIFYHELYFKLIFNVCLPYRVTF